MHGTESTITVIIEFASFKFWSDFPKHKLNRSAAHLNMVLYVHVASHAHIL
jgi:hypothetical protein